MVVKIYTVYFPVYHQAMVVYIYISVLFAAAKANILPALSM